MSISPYFGFAVLLSISSGGGDVLLEIKVPCVCSKSSISPSLLFAPRSAFRTHKRFLTRIGLRGGFLHPFCDVPYGLASSERVAVRKVLIVGWSWILVSLVTMGMIGYGIFFFVTDSG